MGKAHRQKASEPQSDIDHFDVIVVGAGISGIGAAYHLKHQCPDKRYLGEVIDENKLSDQIRYQHSISAASWSSDEQRWTLEGIRKDTGQAIHLSANFLWMC